LSYAQALVKLPETFIAQNLHSLMSPMCGSHKPAFRVIALEKEYSPFCTRDQLQVSKKKLIFHLLLRKIKIASKEIIVSTERMTKIF
jgi:hypothetical protein